MKRRDSYTYCSSTGSGYSSTRGFTLIEVVIAVGVLGVALTVVAMLWAPNIKRSTTLLHQHDLYNAISTVNTQINEESFESVFRKVKDEEVMGVGNGIEVRFRASGVKDISGVSLKDYEGSYFGVEVTLKNKQDALTYTTVKHR